MQRERKLYLTICDYNKNVICDLYDNQSDISGQATNVFINTERNGWKELSFDIPSTCFGENGEEQNYRLNYLIAEYKIRAISDEGTDWFIISEPKITRNNFSKNVSVRAPHVAISLKNKNLDLEFSDDEGNNVGTASALLETILEGTGWTVGTVEDFREDDGTIKQRSLSGSAGTGAWGFINSLCDLFEAKPIFDGDLQTVSLLKMNPFSKIEPEDIPKELIDNGRVIELYYDRNVHNLVKTTNTENMATRMYAYGSSGDLNGACTLQNAEHSEYIFTINQIANEYCFEDLGETKRFFKGNVSIGDKIIFSDMDISSKSYVWNDTKKIAYKVTMKPTGEYIFLTGADFEIVKNKFPFLLSLKYYDDVGLLSDAQFQEIASFQRTLPSLYQESEDFAAAFAEDESQLSLIAESNTGFLKLKVTRDYGTDTDGAKRVYIDDVLYRTDYDVAERRYFQWHVTSQLKANGDPVSGTPSVLFIVHDTNPVTWDKIYLKRIYDQYGRLIENSEGNPGDFEYKNGLQPGSISVWSNSIRFNSTDRFYLFCTNSMSGSLGARQTEDEAVIENLLNTTLDGTEKHTTVFAAVDDPIPDIGSAAAGYGWFYQFNKNFTTVGTLYFCWGAKGDQAWHKVNIDYTPPSVVNGEYYYSLKYKTLWHGVNGQWVKYTSTAEQRVANSFSKVFYYCRRRDMLYKGLYEYYFYNTADLAPDNYAIATDYAFYWTFTTDRRVQGQLKLDTIKGYVYQDTDIEHIINYAVTPFDTVSYPSENELSTMGFTLGTLNTTTGVEEDSNSIYRSSNLMVWENTLYRYSFPARTTVLFYTISLKHISSLALTGSSAASGSFTTPADTKYVRFITSAIPTGYLYVDDYNNKFYINNRAYKILKPIIPDGELIGIVNLTKRFADLADKTYAVDLATLQAAQEEIKERNNNLSISLGDMLKDGRWEDSNYISGDEKRLYDEALDILRQVSMPEITYSFTYLDMFGVKNEHYYEEHDIKWPDITITDTAHLVDTESNTNCWAYLDKINKCYDCIWKTSIEVDTKLTLASRHSFTDVIARIAEVAKDITSKQPQYDRAVSGSVAAERLEGAISLFNSYLKGGSSNWYTDEKGNIIFEAADGLSAMILGGRGLGISTTKDSYGDWLFRTCATGYGITADEIYTGYLSADRIEASSITTDKLMANVGQELDIGSNKALMLFATVNGSRPAGTVKTTDGYIEIVAGYQSGGVTVPAKINVISGGELNLTGGTINITSNGKLDVASSGEFTLKAHGANSLNANADGIYMGSDGINFGNGKFKMYFTGNTSTVYMNAALIQIGSTSTETLQKKLNDMSEATSTAQSTADAKSQTYRCTASQIINNQYRVGDTWVNTGSTYQWEYICKQVSNPRNSTSDWMLVSTSITEGAALSVDATNGTINMVAANTITMAAGATISIAAGQALNLTTKGTVSIGNGGRPFTIGSNGTDAYIYNGPSSIGAATDGAYYGTNGLYIRGTSSGVTNYVKATRDGTVDISGKITTGSGNIGSWYIGSDYIGNKSTKNSSTVGLAHIASGTAITFWAGGTYNGTGTNEPKFWVKNDGSMKATSATITGTINAGSTIACEISADKITSGSMSAARITSGTMSADRISGGTIDANNVTINNLNASNITSGSLSASFITSGTMSANRISGGSIDATNVTITNINASNITSGTISANKISGGTIDATNVTITNINASNITSGTISADKINGGTLSGSTININSGKFSVDANGTVTASKFISVDENGSQTEINLSSQPLWRLSRCVKTLSSDGTTLTIELYNGTSVNFKKAATAILSGSWSGNTFTVSATNDPNVNTISEEFTFTAGTGDMQAGGSTTINTFDENHKAYGMVSASRIPNGVLRTFHVDATNEYNAGVSTGAESVGFASEGIWDNGNKTLTLSNGKTKTVSIPAAVDWSAAYVQNGNMSVSAFVGGKAISSGAMTDPGYSYGVSDGEGKFSAQGGGSSHSWYYSDSQGNFIYAFRGIAYRKTKD